MTGRWSGYSLECGDLSPLFSLSRWERELKGEGLRGTHPITLLSPFRGEGIPLSDSGRCMMHRRATGESKQPFRRPSLSLVHEAFVCVPPIATPRILSTS